MTDDEKALLLARHSRAEMSAIELRRALGGITYGDVLIELARHHLPLPRASRKGREDSIAAAREQLLHRIALITCWYRSACSIPEL